MDTMWEQYLDQFRAMMPAQRKSVLRQLRKELLRRSMTKTQRPSQEAAD